jgi:uncharacterized membrane protein YkvA (DUF1232 family)
MNLLSMIEKTKFFVSLPAYGRLIVRLYRDERVPLVLKMAGIAAAVLIVSPLDPFADIPFLNVLDDAALLMLAARMFFMLSPAAVLAEHRVAVGLDRAAVTIKNITPGRS